MRSQVHPVSVDLGTGAIQSTIKMLHHFKYAPTAPHQGPDPTCVCHAADGVETGVLDLCATAPYRCQRSSASSSSLRAWGRCSTPRFVAAQLCIPNREHEQHLQIAQHCWLSVPGRQSILQHQPDVTQRYLTQEIVLRRITFAGAAVRNVTPGPTQTTDSNDRARLAITHIPAFLDRKQASS